MLKKKRTYYLSTLVFGLCLSISVAIAPALAQDATDNPVNIEDNRILEDRFRISGFFGPCFDSEQSSEQCWVFVGSFQWRRFLADLGLKNRKYSSQPGQAYHLQAFHGWASKVAEEDTDLALQFTVTASATDTWPPPPTGGPIAFPDYSAKVANEHEVAQEAVDVGHTTVASIVELVLPIPVQPKFILEPFAGFGISRVFEGEQRDRDVSLQDAWIPIASYGLAVTAQTKRGFALIVQYRGFVFFPKSLSYTGPLSSRITMNDIGTVTTESLLFGIGISF